MPPKKRTKTHHTSAEERSHGFRVLTTKDMDDVTDQPMTRRHRLRGFLQALPQLPLELRFMIFEQLHPCDLLRLSQTCKAFRKFFLSRENEVMWRLSRENADDIPDRPPFMSEPAFINLLYSPYCHHCGSTVRKVNWEWYTRLCHRCFFESSYDASWLRSRMRIWAKFLPQGDHLGRLFDICSRRPDSNSRDNDCNARFYIPQVDGFLQRLPAPEAVMSSDAVAKAREVVEKHAGEIWERSMYRSDLQQWSIDQGRNRDVVLKERREQRFSEIVDRLRKSGWDEEIDYLESNERLSSSLSTCPLVRQSAKLTEPGWLKVHAALKSFLESTRKKRVEALLTARFRSLGEAITSHCVQLPRKATMHCRPRIIDLAMNEKVRALVEQHSSVAVTAASLSTLVPALVAEWEAERKTELTEFFSHHLGPIPDGVDPLNLATAVIACGGCRACRGKCWTILRYPDILAHECPRLVPDEYQDVPYRPHEDPYAYTAMMTVRGGGLPDFPDTRIFGAPFSLDRVLISDSDRTRASDHMRAIVSALGLDPSRATREDVQRCDARLRCLVCEPQEGSHEGRKCTVYTAEAALHHALGVARDHSGHVKWERVGDECLAAVRDLEAAQHGLSVDTEETYWECSLCHNWSTGRAQSFRWKDGLLDHLSEKHGEYDVQACVENGTIYLNPGCSNALITPPVVVPAQ